MGGEGGEESPGNGTPRLLPFPQEEPKQDVLSLSAMTSTWPLPCEQNQHTSENITFPRTRSTSVVGSSFSQSNSKYKVLR